jgi:hypothetical protein
MISMLVALKIGNNLLPPIRQGFAPTPINSTQKVSPAAEGGGTNFPKRICKVL